MKIYSSRGAVVMMGSFSALNVALLAVMLSLGALSPILIIFVVGGAWLGYLTWVEATKPVIELHDRTLVLRHARVRAPFEVELPRIPMRLDTHLLGLKLEAPEAWIDGRLREISADGGRSLIIGTRQITRADREKLEAALRELISVQPDLR